MNMFKSVVAAAAITAFAATSVTAGGFTAVVDEPTPVVVVPEVAPSGSLPGWVIPVVIAVVLIAIATKKSDTAVAETDS